MESLTIKSPVGALTLFAEDGAIVALDWGEGMGAAKTAKSEVLDAAAQALRDYFKTGKLDLGGIKLAPAGTAFQKRAWRAMGSIKAGRTKSYGQLAAALKSSPRAVGGACACNPIPILIPCHRVLGADGKVGHYSGGEGPATKQFLLRLEGAAI